MNEIAILILVSLFALVILYLNYYPEKLRPTMAVESSP